MAVVRSFEAMDSDASRHPTEVDARWAQVGAGSDAMLHIATYGSDERKSGPKVSQVIQLGREQAVEFKRAIEAVFPGI